MNVLFVCSRNQWRSPTGEAVFRRHPSLVTRSAGVSAGARRKVNAADIVWADIVFAMEEKHLKRLRADFRQDLLAVETYVLDIPDDYRFMDAELVDLIHTAVSEILTL